MSMRVGLAAAVLVAALVSAAAVLGDTGKEKLRFNRADQAAARAAIVRRSDLGAGWTGRAVKPDLSSGPPCANYHPKQSDLVLTGAAASQYQSGAVVLHSQAGVLQTARMVRLDWRRSVEAPGSLPCQRRYIAGSLGTGTKVVSFRRIPFPPLATFAAEFRMEASILVGGGRRGRVVLDSVLVGRRRTEITLNAAAPSGAERALSAAERHLARTLVARARA
jgi:hypothetical protein